MGGTDSDEDALHVKARPQRPRSDPAAVSAVVDASTSLMALLYGGFLGALSALLVMAAASRVLPELQSPLQRAALGLSAWVLSTWIFTVGAARLLVVFRRAFLAGACEWLVLMLHSRSEPTALAATSERARLLPDDVGAGSMALIMLVVCLLGWMLCLWSASPPTGADPPTA